MRLSRIALLGVLSGTLFASAQTNNKQSQSSAAPVPQRDANAVTVLTQAVVALGGEANIATVHDCIASGTFSSSGQTWLRFISFVWKNSGKEYRYEVKNAAGETFIDRSGHGKPSLEDHGKKKPRRDHVPISASPVHLAALRIAEVLADAKYDVIFEGTATLNGIPVFKIRTRYNLNDVEASLTQQDWYFNQSFMPVRVEYQVAANANAADVAKMAADLSNYAPVDGVMVPMQIRFSMDGQVGATATISQIDFKGPISSSDFD